MTALRARTWLATRVDTAPHVAVAAVFAVAAVATAVSGAVVDNEGYLTWLGAVVLWEAPADTFFFQKFHPSISLLFAPAASLGFGTFIVAHALAAAAAIALVGAIGRRWWGPDGWIAALFLGLSPLYFEAAVTGYSNSTGTAFLVLGIFMDTGSRPRRLLAGSILACAVWARYEQAPYVAAYLLLRAVRDREVVPLVGAAVGALAYIAAGAAYHGDPLWVLHFPPTLVVETMPSTIPELRGVIQPVTETLTALSLAAPGVWFALLGLAEWRRDRRLAAVSLFLVGTVLLQGALPLLGGYFNYDFAPRYRINHAAFASLAAAGVLAGWTRGRRGTATAVAVAAVVLALLCLVVWRPPAFVVVMLSPLAACAVDRRQAVRVATAAAGLNFAIGVLLPGGSFRDSVRTTDNVPVEEIRAALTDAPLYTTGRVVQDQLRRADVPADVHFLPGYDIVGELGALLHRDHRQAAKVLAAIEPRLYGEAEWPCDFPRTIEAGSLLYLRDDTRPGAVYDLATWTQGATFVAAFPDRSTLYRADHPIEVPLPSLPDWMPREYFCLPCGAACAVP